MEIVNLPIDSLTPYEKNARKHNDINISSIKESIREFGMNDPIGVWGENNIIVEGHGRVIACKELGITEVPCIRLDHLTDEQRRAYTLAHNKSAELADWDFDTLNVELEDIADIDMSLFGFDLDIDVNESKYSGGGNKGSLKENFIMPPFSVLDTRQGDWQDRKKLWVEKVGDSGDGRDVGLLGQGLYDLAKNSGSKTLTGTSIFDPVLCEIVYNWFSKQGDKVLDPFSGGSTRGIVSQFLEREYYGNDLREEQIQANIKASNKLNGERTVYGGVYNNPHYSIGDSLEIDRLIPDDDFDLFFTCPPYVDLEKYSDDPKDISNMPYKQFICVYSEIIRKSCAKLKDNSFAVIVIGNVRDSKGNYYDFESDTIKAFKAAGLQYYNEIILINAVATLAIRAGRCFNTSRKVGNTHQKILVFVKGSAKEKAKTLSAIDYEF